MYRKKCLIEYMLELISTTGENACLLRQIHQITKILSENLLKHFLCTASPTYSSKISAQPWSIQSWRSYDLQPTDWDWKVTGSNLTPIMTNKDVAPQDLLEMVRCSCKTGCSTMRCSCRKAGLDCSAACGECRGICTNMTALSDGTDSLVDNDTSEH